MRVLIVEDEARLAATLRDLLEINGYTADICHDGESGLDNALSAIYDVTRQVPTHQIGYPVAVKDCHFLLSPAESVKLGQRLKIYHIHTSFSPRLAVGSALFVL